MKHALHVTVVLVVLIGFASTGGAQIASPLHVIPVVAKTAGSAGTDWRSDLAISNVSPFAVTVLATFYREATANTFGLGPMEVVTAQAGETLMVSDVLGTWFPEQGNTKGAIVLMASPAGQGDPSDTVLAVSSRTYNNANPSATYGQTVTSSFMGAVVGRMVSVLPGMRHDARVRTNIGVFTISTDTVPVQISTYDTSGALVAQVVKNVESSSLRQWSLGDLGVSSLAGGRVEVVLDPAAITDPCAPPSIGTVGLIIAYASKVDQTTGDAEFVLGQIDWTDYLDECGGVPPAPYLP